MSAPVGWLLGVAAVLLVLAVLLRAGVAALRSPDVRHPPPTTAVTDQGWTAGAVALGCEFAVVVVVVVSLAGRLSWWLVLVVGLGASAVAQLVRVAATRIGGRYPRLGRTTWGLVGLVARAAAPAVRRLRMEPQVDTIRDMVDRVSESELIEVEEREMFRSVLELGETITRAVMVPRTEMVTIAAGTRLRSALSLFLKSGYSRVPVVGESVDELLGVLYLKDVVRRLHTGGADSEPVDELMRPAVFVPESKPVDDLLREMQAGASHIAIVVDEFGGIAGLVTIEDALEEIVGELTDEHDRAPAAVEELGEGTFRVPSRLPLDELGELFGIEIDDDDVDTAGGLLSKALGKVPLAGSGAAVAGLRLTAERVEGRRRQVATLLVRREGAA